MYEQEIDKLIKIMLRYGEVVEGHADEYFEVCKNGEYFGSVYDRVSYRKLKLFDKDYKLICYIDIDLYPNNAHELILDASKEGEEILNEIYEAFDKEVLNEVQSDKKDKEY